MAYKKLIKDRINDEKFQSVCSQSKSMAEAAAMLGLHFILLKKELLNLIVTSLIRQEEA